MKSRRECIEFLKEHPAKYGRMLGFTKLNDTLHNEWIKDMLGAKEDKTLQGHRGSYKTTCLSVALALIVLLRPSKRTLFMRKTDDDVKEVIKQVQNILKDPHTQYYAKAIYGCNVLLTTESATEVNTNLCMDNKGTSQLVGIGTGSSMTGKHFDYIFTDDIVNVKDRTSAAERNRTKIIYQELHNIVNRGGRIYNTGTPWHKDDCFAIMPEPTKYDCYSTGLMSDAEIEDVKSGMVASLFAANYELRHIASEDVIFDSIPTNVEPYLAEQGLCHIDAAYDGSDYTAFTIMKKHDGKYYIFGKCWRSHVEKCMDEIIRYRQMFNAGKIYCEDNGDKGYLAKDLKRKGERTVQYHESMNKHLKITTYLKAIWKNAEFVEGTDEEYINMILDYNENAEHDDTPDSAASLARILYGKKENREHQDNIYS